MPRYVILEHIGSDTYKPGKHYDLMLEHDGCLKTWELEALPTTADLVRYHKLPDHRLDYLEYEGPVSRDRGKVRRYDSGNYESLTEGDGQIAIRIDGIKYQGRLRLAPDYPGSDFGLVHLQVDAQAPDGAPPL